MKLMVKEAAAIVAERDDLGIRLTGPEVAKRLIRATVSQRQKAGGEIEVKGKGDKAILRYSHSPRGGMTLKILPKSGASREELLRAIEGILEAR